MCTAHGETDNPQVPEFRFLTERSGTRCTLSNPLTGASQTFTLSYLETPDPPSEAVGTRHDITLMRVTGPHMGAGVTQLGARMDHGGFSVDMSSATSDGVRFDSRNAMAGTGDGLAPTIAERARNMTRQLQSDPRQT